MFKLKVLKRRESKKKKRTAAAPPVGDLAREVLMKIAPVVLAFSALLCLAAVFSLSLINLDYFRLRAVETHGAAGISFKPEEILSLYRGRNIFSVDIKAIADNIASKYPDARDVLVKRKLPDSLCISITLRKPVALIKDEKYYPVDSDGVILPNADASLWQKLPVITGVSVKDRSGRRFESRPLKVAFELIGEMEKLRMSYYCNVTAIDVSDPKNVSLFLEDGMEVKMGSENFRARLQKLIQTLKNPKLVPSRIKYIDLRFKDIVIGQK
jgi:cell division septal protein FtsQ